MGRMFITIVAALAQWERENLGERIRMGLQEKVRQGKWAANAAPFGYDIDRENDKLVINPLEASVVRRVFDMYLSGMGIVKIASKLNEEGMKTKSNTKFSINGVRYMLTNPVYIGKMRWNYTVHQDQYFEVEEAAPAIISEETFFQAQKLLEKRKAQHPRTTTSEYIFSGVAKCARCGAPLSGKSNGQGTRFYICTNQKIGTCDLPLIKEGFLEERFLQYINKRGILEEAKKEVAAHADIEEKSDYQKEIEQIQKELAAIEKRRKKWQYAWVNEMITDVEFIERMKEEQKKKSC
jgi:site-specific DNA recombinase